jgi:hypothetical protein
MCTATEYPFGEIEATSWPGQRIRSGATVLIGFALAASTSVIQPARWERLCEVRDEQFGQFVERNEFGSLVEVDKSRVAHLDKLSGVGREVTRIFAEVPRVRRAGSTLVLRARRLGPEVR